jgi:hypothetical protein
LIDIFLTAQINLPPGTLFLTAWGNSDNGGTSAPMGKGFTKIYSTFNAFAALKADGSIRKRSTPIT